ncbi:hypothetical protein RV14_GL001220 [Enterococcus ratti]|uniref:Uncharacterized protein n=1 Tax=Enterococcus ratti TaxID=150033 RepID=A0A1L8WAT2_9ENTE|nr:hypothetical protein RV14_GL001220 [Enterococcus ratti]
MEKIQIIYEQYTMNKYGEEKLENDFKDLYELAKNINPAALPYAQLTTLIFRDDMDEEATDAFIQRLTRFYTKIFEFKKNNNDLKKLDAVSIATLAKVKEHLSLALSQKNSLYNKQKQELSNLKKLLKDEQAHLANLQDQTDNYKEKYDKMTIDFLSMMGIFSTIIFAVFGGLSQIGAIGDNLAETPISKILMYISLSAITLILIVFISFNAISKLTHLKLRSCNCEDEKSCACNVYQKHPTLSFSLFFFIDLFLFSIILKATRHSDWLDPIHRMLSLPIRLESIIKISLIASFLSFNIYMFCKLIPSKKNK